MAFSHLFEDFDIGLITDKKTDDDADCVETQVEKQLESRSSDNVYRCAAGRDSDSVSPDDESSSIRNTNDTELNDVNNPRPPGKEMPQLLMSLAISAVRCVNFFSRDVFCDKVPVPNSALINVLAFHPTAPWFHYYLSFVDQKTGKHQYGNAFLAHNRKGLRIEPVLFKKNPAYLQRLCNFLPRVKPFVTKSHDRYLVCCEIEAVRDRQKNKSKVMLFAGTNGGDVGMTLAGMVGLIGTRNHPDEYDCFLFDYAGYGLSTGEASEKNMYQDIEHVYSEIVNRKNDPDLQIILVGVSIGSAAVADLASKNLPKVAGVVLISPLSSGVRHLTFHKAPKKTSSQIDCFRTLDKAPLINVPLLCIHGMDDMMMSPSNSTEISNAAPKGLKPLFLSGEGHLSLLENVSLKNRLIEFVDVDVDVCHI